MGTILFFSSSNPPLTAPSIRAGKRREFNQGSDKPLQNTCLLKQQEKQSTAEHVYIPVISTGLKYTSWYVGLHQIVFAEQYPTTILFPFASEGFVICRLNVECRYI